MKAVNKAAVCNVLKAYTQAKTRGFTAATRDFLLSVFKDPCEDGEILSESRKKELIDLFQEQFPPKIIPDLFEIDADNKIIRLCAARSLFNTFASINAPCSVKV